MSVRAQAVSLVIFPAPDHCCWAGSASLLTLESQNGKREGAAQAWGPEVAFTFSIAPRSSSSHYWSPSKLNEYVRLQGHRACLVWRCLQIETGSHGARVVPKLPL